MMRSTLTLRDFFRLIQQPDIPIDIMWQFTLNSTDVSQSSPSRGKMERQTEPPPTCERRVERHSRRSTDSVQD